MAFDVVSVLETVLQRIRDERSCHFADLQVADVLIAPVSEVRTYEETLAAAPWVTSR